MKNTKRFLASLLCLMLIASLFAGVATPVYAEETRTSEEIALTPGFYCLHPHRKTPMPHDHIVMEAVPSTEYNGYPQDTLDQVAAAVVLRGQYFEDTKESGGNGITIDGGDLQAVIWAIVCSRPECTRTNNVGKLIHMHLNGRPVAEAYYYYVMENYGSVKGNYVMTIWKAPYDASLPDDANYQDVLEAKLVEKHDVPTVEKKVKDRNDSESKDFDLVGWQDSADHDIGDSIPFQITAQLHDLSKFNTYYLEFCDTMEKLTFEPTTLKITIDGVDKTSGFTTTWDAAAKTLNIKCENVKALGATSNSKVVVTYNATLDEDAVLGNPGNPNEVYLTYSRSTGSADKGTTPKDKVTVFTFGATVNKVGEDGKTELKGAAFELLKKQADGSWKSLGVQGATENEDGSYTANGDTEFSWKGLDDGTYKFVEVVTPTGYNTIEPIEFTISAEHDRLSEDPILYYLVSSYPFTDTYPAEYLEDPELTGNICFDESRIRTDIINKTGTTLPETGGMGTAPVYMAAVVMMFSAAALLLKKRSI